MRAPKWSSPQRCLRTSANSAMRTKSATILLQWIEPTETIGIGGLDENQLVAQVLAAAAVRGH